MTEREIIDDLVTANHILYHEDVVDGFGHVSVRHPTRADRFLLSRSIAPGKVKAEDIMEFDLDGNPVDPRGRKPYLERFIHSEVYRVRADVQSVVHNHSPAVIPFGVTNAPLRPISHMSGFLRALIAWTFPFLLLGELAYIQIAFQELYRLIRKTASKGLISPYL